MRRCCFGDLSAKPYAAVFLSNLSRKANGALSSRLKHLFDSGEAQEFLSAEDRVVERKISELGLLVLKIQVLIRLDRRHELGTLQVIQVVVDLLSSKSPANLVQEIRQLGRKFGVLFCGRHEMEKLLPNQIVQGIL